MTDLSIFAPIQLLRWHSPLPVSPSVRRDEEGRRTDNVNPRSVAPSVQSHHDIHITFPLDTASVRLPRAFSAGRRGALLTPPPSLHPGPRSVPTPAPTAHLPPAPRCGCRYSKEANNTCEPPPNHQHVLFQRQTYLATLGIIFLVRRERGQRSDRRLHLDTPRANHNPQVASEPGHWSAPTPRQWAHSPRLGACAVTPARPDPALGGRRASAGCIGSRQCACFVLDIFTGGCERESPSSRYVGSPRTVEPGPGGATIGQQTSLGSKGYVDGSCKVCARSRM